MYKTRIQKLINIQNKQFSNLSIHVSISLSRKFTRSIYSNYFSRNDEIHHYNTRTSSQLHKSYKRTNYAKHTLSDKGVNIWNNLHDSTHKNIKSYDTFKKKTKKYLLHSVHAVVSSMYYSTYCLQWSLYYTNFKS